jgi:hypothetical protein
MNLIAIHELCESHKIEHSFLDSLNNFGLIAIEESGFVTSDQLEIIEKFIHFHYDLNINLEGIEAIQHLLQKINMMQNEIQYLRNRLRLYEGDV